MQIVKSQVMNRLCKVKQIKNKVWWLKPTSPLLPSFRNLPVLSVSFCSLFIVSRHISKYFWSWFALWAMQSSWMKQCRLFYQVYAVDSKRWILFRRPCIFFNSPSACINSILMTNCSKFFKPHKPYSISLTKLSEYPTAASSWRLLLSVSPPWVDQ